MNYEEKYKKALENAKAGKPIDEIFPELRESEDEKIRKFLIDYFEIIKSTLSDGVWKGFQIEKILAYFEKQKEPLPIPDKFSGLKSIMLQYLQSAANCKDDTEIESDTDLFGRKILDYVWMHDEKQKEQKPNPYTGTGFDYNGHHWGMCARDGGVEIIVDEKIRDRVSFESKNIEWSNSVAKEMFMKALERAVEQTKKGYELTDCDKHSWWEDFKAYSEIKSTEWREEDERLLNIVIDILDREEHNGHLMRSDLKECVKLLKSLRTQHHWKPSEEQMKALEKAMDRNDKIGYKLRTLYNDIKKNINDDIR